MVTKDLYIKYDSAIRSVATANNVDMSVGFSMLMNETYAHFGEFNRVKKYGGVPTDFNYSEFREDIKWL